jgi:hypothetical protein
LMKCAFGSVGSLPVTVMECSLQKRMSPSHTACTAVQRESALHALKHSFQNVVMNWRM